MNSIKLLGIYRPLFARQKEIVKMKDFRESVVYQIYPKSFNDANGDGIGYELAKRGLSDVTIWYRELQ